MFGAFGLWSPSVRHVALRNYRAGARTDLMMLKGGAQKLLIEYFDRECNDAWNVNEDIS